MLVLKKDSQTFPSVLYLDTPKRDVAKLAAQLVQWSLFNLILVACLGVMLRSAPLVAQFPVVYKNLLHGHSHFAFGGWVMPLLVALILKVFHRLAHYIPFHHWRNISVLLLVSAYGMMLAFPLQGYAPVSIFFATLGTVAGLYLAAVICHALKYLPQTPAHRFLKWGLIYLAISSLGPFATGPLVAMGYQATPMYYNAIYFYLHFTYNGWFTFAVLAIWYGSMGQQQVNTDHGNKVFALMQASCIPAFALSVLWNQPSVVFNVIGGIAGLLQLGAAGYLLKDAGKLTKAAGVVRWLLWIALGSFVLKNLLQAFSALPSFAAMAALYRNIVIAYLHLVLIGFISMFLLAQIIRLFSVKLGRTGLWGLGLFLFCFVATELLLAGSSLALVPYLVIWLATLALGMLLGVLIMCAKMKVR